jgi:NMD protein affecting ribosome stability and mRNA decay
MVEQDDAGHAVEPIGDRSPHALVAAEAVREQKNRTRVTRDGDVVAAQNRHGVVRSTFICDDCQADLSSYFEKTLKIRFLRFAPTDRRYAGFVSCPRWAL